MFLLKDIWLQVQALEANIGSVKSDSLLLKKEVNDDEVITTTFEMLENKLREVQRMTKEKLQSLKVSYNVHYLDIFSVIIVVSIFLFID